MTAAHIFRQVHAALHVPSSGHMQAGRKETRTGGRVSQFVQLSGHHFSSWRAGAVSPPHRGHSYARRPETATGTPPGYILCISQCFSLTHLDS